MRLPPRAPRPAGSTIPPAVVVIALAWAVAAACAPQEAFAPPAERHARADARLGADLAAHLAALPGVADASVVVRTPRIDPLGPLAPLAPLAPPAPAGPARASVILTLAPGADAAAATDAARAAVVAAVPGLAADAIAVVAAAPPGPARAGLTRVGPFEVDAGSRRPLQLALAAALVAIAALAGWVVALELRRRRAAAGHGRRGIRPQ
jgi:type III secretory pathway lipoprotein EscJ